MLRRSPLTLALLLTLALAGGPTAASAGSEEVLRVNLDQAKIDRLPEGTATLVIGNPIVADVTMLKGSGAMVVTGKGFGDTNLIALDAQGNVIYEKTVRVVPTASTLVVQRGMDRESYSCSPQCVPTIQLGDAKGFNTDASGELSARNGLLAPSQGLQQQH
jgi:hypothetical protein